MKLAARKRNINAEKRRKKLLLKKYQYVLLILIISVLVTLGWGFIKMGYHTRTANYISYNSEKCSLAFSKYFGLIIKDIYVEGYKHTPLKKIKEKLKVSEGSPILFISISQVRDEIKKLEWVSDVVIERHIPSTLHVRIKEKEPVAIWQYKGELALIDKKGEVISKNFISEFPGLPLVVGERANLSFIDIYEVLSSEDAYENRLSSMISVNGRRWNIRLDSGLEIMLPELRPEAALLYLAKLHKKNKILDKKLKYIDMRVEDRLFIKPLSKPAAQEIISEEKTGFDKVIDAIESIKKKKE